jgi:mannose-1-phosphate guanylyltransferase
MEGESRMKVVIMAGGQGTRFWPWSIKEKPKQFLPLVSKDTMLQQTYNRFQKWLPSEKIYIVTTKEYISFIKKQIPLIDDNQIIIEPAPRDTAPCLALTALHFLQKNDDEVFAAVPADHYIPEDTVLQNALLKAETAAQEFGSIVTLGIKPTRPETGYGYIQAAGETVNNREYLEVEKFVEKPSIEVAEKLLMGKHIYWNSGMFIWKPSTIEYYMRKFQPDIWNLLNDTNRNLNVRYYSLPKISIDFAILEKAEKIYTIPVSIYWDDVGNWSALERLNQTQKNDNYAIGDIHTLDTTNCIIKSDYKKTVVIGVQDLIIVSTKEGLLVCHKDYEQKIKGIINEM